MAAGRWSWAGHWETMVQSVARGYGGSLPCKHSADAISTPDDGKGWRNWKGILTWAVALKCLEKVLPISLATLRALVWEALAVGCSSESSMARAMIDAILERHGFFQLQPPLEAQEDYTCFTMALGRFQGSGHHHRSRPP